jgi:hypothetical protein
VTDQLVLDERLVDQLERRAARRVVEAADEFYAAARAYGLDVEQARELHAPLSLRIDAWLERTRHLLRPIR